MHLSSFNLGLRPQLSFPRSASRNGSLRAKRSVEEGKVRAPKGRREGERGRNLGSSTLSAIAPIKRESHGVGFRLQTGFFP